MTLNTTEFLFPPRLIPELNDLRGEEWRELIELMSQKDPISIERIGFELFIVRLNNCITCHIDSYRSLHGCLRCTRQTISRYRGNDHELINLYKNTTKEIEAFLKRQTNNYWSIEQPHV